MDEETTAFDLQRMFIGDEPVLATLEIIVRTAVMFVYTVALVRVLGKRGMRQLTPFELVIIIALGSAVGDPMFYADVPLLHGIVVVTIVVILEAVLAFATGHSARLEHAIEGTPTLLVHDGRIDLGALERERIPPDEVFADLREAGYDNLADVRFALIEDSGNLSVFPADADPARLGRWLMPDGVDPPGERVADGWLACARCGEIRRGPNGDQPCPRCRSANGWRPAVRTPDPAAAGA